MNHVLLVAIISASWQRLPETGLAFFGTKQKRQKAQNKSSQVTRQRWRQTAAGVFLDPREDRGVMEES